MLLCHEWVLGVLERKQDLDTPRIIMIADGQFEPRHLGRLNSQFTADLCIMCIACAISMSLCPERHTCECIGQSLFAGKEDAE